MPLAIPSSPIIGSMYLVAAAYLSTTISHTNTYIHTSVHGKNQKEKEAEEEEGEREREPLQTHRVKQPGCQVWSSRILFEFNFWLLERRDILQTPDLHYIMHLHMHGAARGLCTPHLVGGPGPRERASRAAGHSGGTRTCIRDSSSRSFITTMCSTRYTISNYIYHQLKQQ